jgi:hypothetical protein
MLFHVACSLLFVTFAVVCVYFLYMLIVAVILVDFSIWTHKLGLELWLLD